jgi:beta-alanine degradation protein BauB
MSLFRGLVTPGNLTGGIACSVLLAAGFTQIARQYDAAVFENQYLRAHVVTLNVVGHYRTTTDVAQAVYCLGSFVVSRDNGSRRRCTKDEVLFVERGDQIELRADVEPRPDLLVVELKQPHTGQFFMVQEDATNAAPEVYRLLLENRAIRIFRMTLAPGQRTKMHWHPGGDFLFPFTTATTRITSPEGEARTLELQARVPRWTPSASRHIIENAGKTEASAVIFEVK